MGGGAVLVQRVLMPVSGRESWTVLGDDGEVVAPVERYLAYLARWSARRTRCGLTRSA